MAGVFCIAITAITLLIYEFELTNSEKDDMQHNRIIISELAELLESEYNHRFVILQTIAKTPEIIGLLEQSNEEFSKYDNIQKIIDERDSSWTLASENEITPFMKQIIDSKISGQFRELQSDNPNTYGEIFLTNQYGALVAASEKTTDYRQDDEIWWQNTKSNSVNIDDIQYDKSSKTLGNKISLRINGNDGKMIGIITAVTTRSMFDEIDEDFKSEFTNAGMTIRIMTQDGIVFYSTNNHELLQDFSETEMYKNITQDNGEFTIKEGDNYDTYSYASLDKHGIFPGIKWYVIVHDTRN